MNLKLIKPRQESAGIVLLLEVCMLLCALTIIIVTINWSVIGLALTELIQTFIKYISLDCSPGFRPSCIGTVCACVSA